MSLSGETGKGEKDSMKKVNFIREGKDVQNNIHHVGK